MTRTFLLVQLDSEGAPFSEIADLLQNLGFKRGAVGYDFVYEWGRDIGVGESLGFADRIQAALKGRKVGFRIESSDG